MKELSEVLKEVFYLLIEKRFKEELEKINKQVR